MANSSYYHANSHEYKRLDEATPLLKSIMQIRTENEDYGYRRVTLELNNRGLVVNHKHVLKLMRDNGLLCTAFKKKSRKYNSYRGTVGKVSKNLLNRRFYTNRPYQKLVTEVTEL